MIALKAFLQKAGLFRRERAWTVLMDSAIAGFPYPVLRADSAGYLFPANDAAKPLCVASRQGDVPGVGALVTRAVNSGEAQFEVVMVPGPAGAMLYELIVLPTRDKAALVVAKDVTLENNLRTALVESRQRYKDLVEISTDFAWEIGSDGAFGFVSPCGALGFSAGEMVGRKPEQFLVEQSGIDGLLPFHADYPVQDAEVWMRRVDGGVACLRASSSPMLDAEGKRRGARGIWQDVTRERERERALSKADNRERLLSYIVRAIRDVADPTDMLHIAAEATSLALGGAAGEIFRFRNDRYDSGASFGDIGNATSVLSRLAGTDFVEDVVDGRPVLGAVSRYRQQVNGAIVVWRPADDGVWNKDDRILIEGVADQIGIANEQIANHEHILALSRTDALTGLFNRRAFFEELSRRFSRLERDQRPASLIYIDLDNFKAVNDRYGHKRGDDALVAVRDIMMQHTRPIDLVARLGGDEFAVWLEGADESIAIKRCEEIIAAAKVLLPFSGDDEAPLTMSLGVAVYDTHRTETLDDLLQRADEAMYGVKRGGKCDYRLAPAAVAVRTEEEAP
ncbi:MAG TPA: diguanylate cyclase [Telmatospirillum sp.]|nr:diguanylate cyclase [Telmatospirillum sp.]